MKRIRPLIVLVVNLFLLVDPVSGHTTSESVSLWEKRPGGIQSTIVISRREASRVVGALSHTKMTESFLYYSKDKIRLTQAGVTCEPGEVSPLPAAGDYIRLERLFVCPENDIKDLELTVTLLTERVPFHTHFARWRTGGGRQEFVFRSGLATQTIAAENEGATPKPEQYAWIGIEHIAFGYDHLVFLALILLLAGGLKPALWAVTGFTVGHSLSLALSATKMITVNSAAVEALIGLTIILAAIELSYRQKKLPVPALGVTAALFTAGLLTLAGAADAVFSPVTWFGLAVFVYFYFQFTVKYNGNGRHLVLMTLLFGFIHGFGFAGFLLDVGLPDEGFLAALLFFNIGIEAGQIAVGALMVLSVTLLRRLWPRGVTLPLQEAAAGMLALTGAFWFFSRTF